MIHMGRDHKCVMTRFAIPAKATKKARLSETTPRRTDEKTRGKEQVETMRETMDEHGFEARYRDLEHAVKSAEPTVTNKTGGKKKEAAAATAAAVTAAAATDAQKEAAATDEAASGKKEAVDKDEEILAFIHERKTIKKDEKERIREVSKKIKKCIREKKRTARQEKIQNILEELSGTKNISNVKSATKRILIPKIKNMEGETITT